MKKLIERVEQLCAEVYTDDYTQIVIDLVQEQVEEVVQCAEDGKPFMVDSVLYQIDILHKVFNPIFTKDIELLIDLRDALAEML